MNWKRVLINGVMLSFAFAVIVLSGTVVTRITDDIIEVDEMNEILYVDAGNATDIQAKIDSCPSNGCIVHIPDGTYTINSEITLPNNITLKGSGFGTIITGTNTNLVANEDASGGNDNIHVSDIHLIGNRTGTAGYGFYIANVTNSSFQDIWIEKVKQHGFQIADSSDNVLMNIKSFNNDQDGILMADSSERNKIIDCHTYGNDDYGVGIIEVTEGSGNPTNNIISGLVTYSNDFGILTKGAIGTIMDNNVIYMNRKHGIQDGSPSTQWSNYTIISNNLIKNNAQSESGHSGLYTHTCHAVISGNIISDDQGTHTQSYGIYANGDCNNTYNGNHLGEQLTQTLFSGNNTNIIFQNYGYEHNRLRWDTYLADGNFTTSGSHIFFTDSTHSVARVGNNLRLTGFNKLTFYTDNGGTSTYRGEIDNGVTADFWLSTNLNVRPDGTNLRWQVNDTRVEINTNLWIAGNNKVCLDHASCSHYIQYNGTHTVIE